MQIICQVSTTDTAIPIERRSTGWSWARFTRNALIIVAVVALTVWAWVDNAAPNLFPKNFGEVTTGEVYRSGRLTPEAMRKVVEDKGVRTIVDLGAWNPGSGGDQRERLTAESLGASYVRLPLFGDGRGDPNQYVRALRVITDPGAQPVLVHCAAGSERTGVAIALYRMIEQGWTIDQAMDEARRFRHDPAGNPHVREMLDTWCAPIEGALRTGAVIPYDGPSPEDQAPMLAAPGDAP